MTPARKQRLKEARKWWKEQGFTDDSHILSAYRRQFNVDRVCAFHCRDYPFPVLPQLAAVSVPDRLLHHYCPHHFRCYPRTGRPGAEKMYLPSDGRIDCYGVRKKNGNLRIQEGEGIDHREEVYRAAGKVWGVPGVRSGGGLRFCEGLHPRTGSDGV